MTVARTARGKRARLYALGVAGAIALAAVPAVAHGGVAAAAKSVADMTRARAATTLKDLLARACDARWDTLAIGERIARFGQALEGTPYEDGTLEGPGPEVCRVTTGGLDCVTFMELCLDLARISGPEGPEAAFAGARRSEAAHGDRPACRADSADVFAAVTFTRYRGGRLTDYTSRLHYTSEWIADNVRKGVLDDVTASLGGADCARGVDFMSTHPDAYAALKTHPALVDSMRRIERAIVRLPRFCVPKDRVAAAEPGLHTGDLVAIATSTEGLDYAHTGIIVRDAHGVARFMHASSKHGKVILDGSLSDYLAGAPKSFTGVTIARPLEVE